MDRVLRRWLKEAEVVEKAGPGPQGWAPSRAQLEAGQTAFAGLVLDGDWSGSEVLISVFRSVRPWRRRLGVWLRRQSDPHGAVEFPSFWVDYWPGAAPGESDPGGPFHRLEHLQDSLAASKSEWYPPTRAARAVDRVRTGHVEDRPTR